MGKSIIIEHISIDDFHRKIADCSNVNSRFFKVKLIQDVESQEYAGTIYFEIVGEISDHEIRNTIVEQLDNKYRFVDLFQIFEVTNIR